MISLIILGIIFLYAIISYNTLTRKRNNVDNDCTAIRETRRRDVC